MHFTCADESEVLMFVPEQNKIKAVGIEKSRTLNSTLFRINTTMVSVKPTASVLLPVGEHARNGEPLPFGSLLHGVTTRSKRNLTAIVTAPVLSRNYAVKTLV